MKWITSHPLWAFALLTYGVAAVLFLLLMPDRPQVASAIAVGGGVQALTCWWMWGDE